MINKLGAAVIKEALLLLRDKVGLAILFIMPMILIMVMTLIQDSAFKSLNEKGIPIVLVDEDHDSLSAYVYNGLKQSDLCTLTDSIDGKPATAESAREAIANGEFLVGIVIPANATHNIRERVNVLVDQTLNTGDSIVKPSTAPDSVRIGIIIDPITKKSFVSSITASLREFISETKTRILFQSFSQQISNMLPEGSQAPQQAFEQTRIISYRESYASGLQNHLVPNAVQHNVPAWTIFAMFFIVIPLAGSIMKEKTEGSVFRLHTMPSSYLLLINGKIIVYVLVCAIQFILMMSVGLYILPLFGLPTLVMGNSLAGILMVTMATSFAATGYGVMVGTIASSEIQGAILGALSILLLSAIGGVWVPTYVMPQTMRELSIYSPLNWSLEGFYSLFLRGEGVSGVLYPSIKLILFFLFTMSVASVVHRFKRSV